VCCKFRNWTTNDLVEFSSSSILVVVVPSDYCYFALNYMNLFKVKFLCCWGMTGEVPHLSDSSSGEFVHTRFPYKFGGEGCTT
jgi:hypothetical protein